MMLATLSPRIVASCLLVGAALATSPVRGDVVKLHSGAELRGKIVTAKTIVASGTKVTKAAPTDVTLETLSGARIEIPADSIAFVTRRPLAHEHYEVRARGIEETVDAHWELARWCRDSHLNEQHEYHCQRVIALDSDHEAAHRALGHVWKDGGWIDWNAYMTERGYLKHKGRWITQPEFELLEKTTAELAREQEWYPKIRLWTGWITSNSRDRVDQGLSALQAVQDADAAPAIAKLMGKHAGRDVRLLAVNVLTQSVGAKSSKALAVMTLTDADAEVRYAALQGIAADQFEHVEGTFIQKLRSADNAEVNRAAVALQRVGDEDAITPLINALITTHRYNVRVRGAATPTYTMGTGGAVGNQSGTLPPGIEAGLRTGQYPDGVVLLNSPDPVQNVQSKWVVVQQDHQNADVLATLQKLTGEDFSYDERTWHLWWAAQKHAGGLGKS